jgi:hypothetical protein
VKSASAELIALLESGQFVFWENYTFTRPDGTSFQMTTRDVDAIAALGNAPAPPSDTTFYLDTFTDTPGTPLTSHTSDSGATYAGFFGNMSTTLIQANGVNFGASVGVNVNGVANVPATGQVVLEADLTFTGTGNGNWTLACASNAEYSALQLYCYRVSGVVSLTAYIQAPVTFDSVDLSTTVADGDTYRVALVLSADRVTCSLYVDGVLVDSGVLPTPMSEVFDDPVTYYSDNLSRILLVRARVATNLTP